MLAVVVWILSTRALWSTRGRRDSLVLLASARPESPPKSPPSPAADAAAFILLYTCDSDSPKTGMSGAVLFGLMARNARIVSRETGILFSLLPEAA